LHYDSSKISTYINLYFSENESIKISPNHAIFVKRNLEEETQTIFAKNV